MGKSDKGSKHPFAVNEKRFLRQDHNVPGAGAYELPSAIHVKNPKQLMPSYKSSLDRSLDLVVGKDNPGIGEYDTQHYQTMAVKEFQGGAANNFVLFTRQNQSMRNVEIPEKPRLPEPVQATPAALGPGSYHPKQQDQQDGSIQKAAQPGVRQNLAWGTDPRFKFDFQKAVSPGPGQYNDQNKWNKRTYNLKFLNFQAHAFQNQQKFQKASSNTKSTAAMPTVNNSSTVMQNQRLYDAQRSGYTQGGGPATTAGGQSSNFEAPRQMYTGNQPFATKSSTMESNKNDPR